jgi:chorismate mutase / prephenate dehydratase
MPVTEVAFLGPIGTYSQLVAEKKFGRRCRFVPFPSILDVCAFVSRRPDAKGVVPIENSSGGAVYETVDILLANRPRVFIEEELALEVRLALLGHEGATVKVLYSHFAPLEHCNNWLRKNLPRAEKRVVSSTAVAAQRVSQEWHAAALANRNLAKLYCLKVLHYPVEAEVPNVTLFLVIAGKKPLHLKATKGTLAVRLPNQPGSLCTFLEAFRNENVNLSRIISRPLRGCPREYAFLVDIEGAGHQPNVKRALRRARQAAVMLRIVGEYPTHAPYKS